MPPSPPPLRLLPPPPPAPGIAPLDVQPLPRRLGKGTRAQVGISEVRDAGSLRRHVADLLGRLGAVGASAGFDLITAPRRGTSSPGRTQACHSCIAEPGIARQWDFTLPVLSRHTRPLHAWVHGVTAALSHLAYPFGVIAQHQQFMLTTSEVDTTSLESTSPPMYSLSEEPPSAPRGLLSFRAARHCVVARLAPQSATTPRATVSTYPAPLSRSLARTTTSSSSLSAARSLGMRSV